MSDQVEQFLEHHGIKGQKWGIRKRNPNLDRISRMSTAIERRKKFRQKWGPLVISGSSAASIAAGAAFAAKAVRLKDIPLNPGIGPAVGVVGIAGIASGIAGAKFAKHFLNKHK